MVYERYDISYNDGGVASGSGYYGGGAGGYSSNIVTSGGGISSFISDHPGCIPIKSATVQAPVVATYANITDSYHYSGLVFNNTKMVDGTGYEWTSIKLASTKMPTHDGSGNMTGNTDN